MSIHPQPDQMQAHMRLLYDWTADLYSNARFEVRCIPAEGRGIKSGFFDCSAAGYAAAAEFAARLNRNLYNVYVTVNPLKPGTAYGPGRAANDDDVEIALHHYTDGDGVEIEPLIAQYGFLPAFRTITGIIPLPRHHTYWRMSKPVRDMQCWRETQDHLARTFGTGIEVKNPSRVDRLAGSISHPIPRKAERGYVTELVTLTMTGAGEVCRDSFVETFRRAAPPPVAPQAAPAASPSRPTVGTSPYKVPLDVVEAALEAIPPIMGKDQRNVWLDVAQACRDANPNSFHLFDKWQCQSDRWDEPDARLWDTLSAPSPGSFRSLFAHAKRHKPDWWWSHSGEVYEWWCDNAARLQATGEPKLKFDSDRDKEPDGEPEPEKAKPKLTATPLRMRNLTKIPPRRWLYGRRLLRGMVTVLGGTGGIGKSSLVVGTGLSVALGRPLFARDEIDEAHVVHRQGAVWYYNLEDPTDELDRRIAAEIAHRNFNVRHVWDSFYVDSGRDKPLTVAKKDRYGNVMREPIIDALVEEIESRGIVLLIVDPFALSHEVGESENDDIKIVVDQWRKVAHHGNCAVWLVHHFRKGGQAGDADSFRGASQLQNGARVMETLTTMTEEDAKALGVPIQQRRDYVKLENAKANLSRAAQEAEWYRFGGVRLNNGDEDYPEGDVIGVLDRWVPVSPMHGKAWDQVAEVLDAIDAGTGDGEFYAAGRQSKRWVGAVLMRHLGMNDQQAANQIKEWLGGGVLVKDRYKSPSRNQAETGRVLVAADGRQNIERRMAGRA